jgi:hypothetical protein
MSRYFFQKKIETSKFEFLKLQRRKTQKGLTGARAPFRIAEEQFGWQIFLLPSYCLCELVFACLDS